MPVEVVNAGVLHELRRLQALSHGHQGSLQVTGPAQPQRAHRHRTRLQPPRDAVLPHLHQPHTSHLHALQWIESVEQHST